MDGIEVKRVEHNLEYEEMVNEIDSYLVNCTYVQNTVCIDLVEQIQGIVRGLYSIDIMPTEEYLETLNIEEVFMLGVNGNFDADAKYVMDGESISNSDMYDYYLWDCQENLGKIISLVADGKIKCDGIKRILDDYGYTTVTSESIKRNKTSSKRKTTAKGKKAVKRRK